MSMPGRWSTLFICVTAAAVFYFLGFTTGAVVFITLGVVFEMAFWINLFRRRDSG